MITYEDLVGAWLGTGATGDTILRLGGTPECPLWVLDRLGGPLSAAAPMAESQGGVEFDDCELTVTLAGGGEGFCAPLRFDTGPAGIKMLSNGEVSLFQLRLLVGLQAGSPVAESVPAPCGDPGVWLQRYPLATAGKGSPGVDAWVWLAEPATVEVRRAGDGSLWICEYATYGPSETALNPLLCEPGVAMIRKPREGNEAD